MATKGNPAKAAATAKKAPAKRARGKKLAPKTIAPKRHPESVDDEWR